MTIETRIKINSDGFGYKDYYTHWLDNIPYKINLGQKPEPTGRWKLIDYNGKVTKLEIEFHCKATKQVEDVEEVIVWKGIPIGKSNLFRRVKNKSKKVDKPTDVIVKVWIPENNIEINTITTTINNCKDNE